MFLSSHLVWTSDYTHFGIICGRNNRCHTGGRPHIIFFLYNYRCLVKSLKSFVTVYILRREVIWPSFLAENLLEAEIRPPNRNSDTFQYKIPTSTPHVPECPRVARCRRIRRSRFKIHILFGRTKWKQIEAARQNIRWKIKREGKLEIPILTDIPIRSRKPTAARMGKGKGKVNNWVASMPL